MSDRHPELDAEQAYLDFAYACLEDARERAQRASGTHDAQQGGTTQHRFERESMIESAVNRLTQLNLGDRSLVFGRIDIAPEAASVPDERFYIGRLAVWDRDQDPVVVDWRAPVAEPFYRATGREPMGLDRRRHFAARGRTLLGLDDELFGDLADVDAEDLGTRGQGALIAALEASRTGRLGDIVATIQGEQDEIIRAAMPGVLVVQGGPGTGKTVVALHRAAYLLYTHRFPLEGQGVLVLGPNRLFVAYIEQVLPSLGEAGVDIAVLADLLRPKVRVDKLDDEPTARVKGDVRMIKVLSQAVQDRERPLRSDLQVGFGVQLLRITAAESAAVIKEARRRSRGHNSGRKIVEELFFERLAASARRHVDAKTVRERIRHELPIREALDWMWPVLSPAHLLHDLYGSKALLRSANRDRFSEEEILRLYRPRASHASDVIWRFPDVPLLDEARALLGYRPGRRDEDAVRTYGHICIDEAQDLSPMELRMVARRSLNGSMTVVGDIAQATGAWANEGWDSIVSALPEKREPRHRELTIGYRIPGPAMSLANAVLPHAAPGLRPPQPVREDGAAPRIVGTDNLRDDLVEVVRNELGAVVEGNVAVIVPDSLVDEVNAAFDAHEMPVGGPTRHGLDQQVTVVPVRLVKGLEVDSAVVVEPGRIIAEERQGIRSLYVALTRATKRVAVVHREPLPGILDTV
ncbi:MAG: DNA/RNA helicase domain-containing protein [Actinomycetota bacterium]